MTEEPRAALNPVTVVATVAGVLAVTTAVVLTLALRDGDADDAARSTTTMPAPSTTTTAVVERQVSLVGDGERGPLFDVAGVSVTARDLGGVSADDPVPADYPVVVDPAFVAAQERADLSLDRLRHQVQYLANRLGPAVGEAELEPPLVVVARPRLDDDGTLDAAVLVVNTAGTARRLAFFDLRVLSADGSPVTARIRFLGEAGGVEVAAHTAYFNLVAFSEDQVLDTDADLDAYSWEGEVMWEEPAASG